MLAGVTDIKRKGRGINGTWISRHSASWNYFLFLCTYHWQLQRNYWLNFKMWLYQIWCGDLDLAFCIIRILYVQNLDWRDWTLSVLNGMSYKPLSVNLKKIAAHRIRILRHQVYNKRCFSFPGLWWKDRRWTPKAKVLRLRGCLSFFRKWCCLYKVGRLLMCNTNLFQVK